MTGIHSNNKIMKEIFEYACNNEENNSVSLDVLENKQVQNAIFKAIDDCRHSALNLNSAFHICLAGEEYWK